MYSKCFWKWLSFILFVCKKFFIDKFWFFFVFFELCVVDVIVVEFVVDDFLWFLCWFFVDFDLIVCVFKLDLDFSFGLNNSFCKFWYFCFFFLCLKDVLFVFNDKMVYFGCVLIVLLFLKFFIDLMKFCWGEFFCWRVCVCFFRDFFFWGVGMILFIICCLCVGGNLNS